MLHKAIKLKANDGDQAVVTEGGSVCWSELARWVDQLCRDHEHLHSRRVALCLDGSALSLAVLAALEELCCDTFVVKGDVPLSAALLMAERFRLGAILTPRRGQGPMRFRRTCWPEGTPAAGWAW